LHPSKKYQYAELCTHTPLDILDIQQLILLWCRYLSWVSGWTEASEENNVETAPSQKNKRKIEQMAKAARKVKMLEVPSGTNVAHIYIYNIYGIYI
jgi:hypothetical protein